MEYRLQVYKQTCYLVQYPPKVVTKTADAKIKICVINSGDKEILFVIAYVNSVEKEFEKHEYCHKNHARVLSKSFDFMSNTPMENFAPDLNSAIDTIEQGVILERRYVSVHYLLRAYDDWKGKNCQRFFRSKLTEKYDNPLLFVTVE